MADQVDRVTTRPTTLEQPAGRRQKRYEILLFIFLAIIFWPVMSIAVVGGYGFLVWMYQLLAGPPGPPPV